MTGQFKKDDYLFGTILGIVLPVISAAVIFIILQLIGYNNVEQYIKFYLFSVVINILLVRYYLINLKYEKTGKALLFVTFVVLIAFFILYFQK